MLQQLASSHTAQMGCLPGPLTEKGAVMPRGPDRSTAVRSESARASPLTAGGSVMRGAVRAALWGDPTPILRPFPKASQPKPHRRYVSQFALSRASCPPFGDDDNGSFPC